MEVGSGEIVKLVATDPAAHLDIGVFVEIARHEMVDFQREENRQIFLVRKA